MDQHREENEGIKRGATPAGQDVEMGLEKEDALRSWGQGEESGSSRHPEGAEPHDAGESEDFEPNAAWPELADIQRVHRRRTHPRRHKRRRLVLKVLVGIVLVLGLAAGGAAWAVKASIERGRAAFQESMQRVLEQSSNTIQFEGKTYAPNEHMVTVCLIGFDNRTESSAGYEVSGQSDMVVVLALNTETGAMKGILIPRDSMVAVDTYVGGDYAGQSTMQLCLQYTYGSSSEQSSELVAQAASRVLEGMPIDYYFTLNIDGVAPINDAIGGVQITPVETVERAGAYEGQPTTLVGDAAESYVRYRDTSDPDSSAKRARRQISYLRAFASQVLTTFKGNPGALVDLYQTALTYTWTNLGTDEFSYLASTMLAQGVTSFDFKSLSGEWGAGERYAEFYLDQSDVQRTVIETFYHEVEAAPTTGAAVDSEGGAASPEADDAQSPSAEDPASSSSDN